MNKQLLKKVISRCDHLTKEQGPPHHVWIVEQRVYNHKTDKFDIWKPCADKHAEFKMFKTRVAARQAIDHFQYGFAPKRVMKYERTKYASQ